MIREILVLPHSHFDHGYVHTPVAERVLQARWFAEALDLLDREPTARWCSELTTPVLDWLELAGPDAVARARRLVAEGRLGTGALRWNTTPLSDAEELRWLARDAAVIRSRLGDPCRTAVQHDVNGIPWPAVGILLDAGVDTLVMGVNTHQGGCAVGRHRFFRWRGPDGRSLVVCNGDIYSTACRLLADGSSGAMREAWARYRQHLDRWGVTGPVIHLTHTLRSSTDCNPPDHELPGLVARWNGEGIGPRMRLATLEDLRTAAHAAVASDGHEFHGDWTDFWNFGAGSSATHTALARRARRRLRQAETIASAAVDPRIAEQVRESVAGYHEHTWGSASSCSGLGTPEVELQWAMKAATAATAAGLADLCLRDALHALAGNSRRHHGAQGVLVVNPGAGERRAALAIPPGWRTADWDLHASSWHALDGGMERSPPSPGPALTLPGRSWRILSWAEIDALTGPANDGPLRSADLEVSVDDHGRIAGLVRRADGIDLLAGALDVVHETVAEGTPDPRSSYFTRDWSRIEGSQSNWQADWPAQRSAAPVADGRIETRGAARVVVRELAFPGWHACRLEAEVHPDLPGIGLRLVGRLRDTVHPEAWYLAIPLALPAGWGCRFDTAGCPVELDADQLPGASRDWVTVDRWIALQHGGRGAMLACPDAPLAMPAGFAFAKDRARIPRDADPLLLAWPLNSYWQTNFRPSQPGPIDLRWRLGAGPADDRGADALCDTADGFCVHPVGILPDRRTGILPGSA